MVDTVVKTPSLAQNGLLLGIQTITQVEITAFLAIVFEVNIQHYYFVSELQVVAYMY